MRALKSTGTVSLIGILLGILMVSCSAGPSGPLHAFPTYDPFVRESAAGAGGAQQTGPGQPAARGPTPTLAPLSVIVPTRPPGSPLVTPTPNPPRLLPASRRSASEYVVQPGDTLAAIAQSFGVGVETLLEANGLNAEDLLALGTTLVIPPPVPGAAGSAFKVIPDSELVYGPAAAEFDIQAFIAEQNGHLADYTEDIDTSTLSGAEVVGLVAREYSVNPRLLLAILEHQSHWVSTHDPSESTLDFPLGLAIPSRAGLYHQLAWAANELNRGFYLWRANAIDAWVLVDETVVPIDATINAGTAGVQSMFAALDERSRWDQDVDVYGLFQTYFFLFGSPFDRALEPLTPSGLSQPRLELPFESGVAWAFTGGPHAAWDSGSAWGALDFAPPDVLQCAVSEEWVTAAGTGFIVRSDRGAVVQDLDGDGFEQTGWDILYMHVFQQDRAAEGAFLYAGDRIGHPSCEGGISNASHLHIARKFNGEWISADGSLPFVLGGWTSSGAGAEYDGFLRRGSSSLEAEEGATSLNQITR